MNRRDYIKQTALLLGTAVSAGTLSEILLSCRQSANLDWKPAFFTGNQAATITEMAETILPKTNTPGAKDVGVPQFIDKIIHLTMDDNGKKTVIEGYEQFETACKDKFGKSFTELDPTQKTAFLVEQDKASAGFPLSMWGIMLDPDPKPISFYRRIKGLTLSGYFTSEKIGKDVLVYDPIPGHYEGCIPYKGENQWTEG